MGTASSPPLHTQDGGETVRQGDGGLLQVLQDMSAIEIDHVQPVNTFDSSTNEGASKAFAYTNTQALPTVLHAVRTATDKAGKQFSLPSSYSFSEARALLAKISKIECRHSVYFVSKPILARANICIYCS